MKSLLLICILFPSHLIITIEVSAQLPDISQSLSAMEDWQTSVWYSSLDTFDSVLYSAEKEQERIDFTCSLYEITSYNKELVIGLMTSYGITQRNKILLLFNHTVVINIIKDYPIPDCIIGKDEGKRLENYASDLGRKVRLSYPTQVVEQMIEKEELAFKNETIKNRILIFLKVFPNYDFTNKNTDVDSLVTKLFNQIHKSEQDEIIDGLKTLQRIFRLSTSPDAMLVILNGGFHSAADIVSLPKRKFNRAVEEKICKRDAKIIYRNALSIVECEDGQE